MTGLAVQVSDLCFSFEGGGATPVLDGVNLHLAGGEFVAVVGPSGCGKSTLIHILGGFLRPSSGKVLLHERPVEGPSATRGIVFQNLGLFPWRTVRENVEFGVTVGGASGSEASVNELLRAIRLEPFEHFYPAQLSGGMAQRVALARTLATGPAILLLDEPFGALDAQTRLDMQLLLAELHARRRLTVMLVTHDVEEALFLADRVLVMSARPGRIVKEFAPSLPRPRSYVTLTDALLVNAKRDILHTLRGEVLSAEVQSKTALLRKSRQRFVTIGCVAPAEALVLRLVALEAPARTIGDLRVEPFEHETGLAVLNLVQQGTLDLGLVGACPVLARMHTGPSVLAVRDGGYTFRGRAGGGGLVVGQALQEASLDEIATWPIGINGVGTNSEILTRAALAATGRELNFRVMPATQLVGELRAGRIAVAALFAPHLEEALAVEGVCLKSSFLDLIDPLQLSLLVGRPDYTADERIQAFLEVWDKTIERLSRWLRSEGDRWPALDQVRRELGLLGATEELPMWDVGASVDRAAALDRLVCQVNGGLVPFAPSDFRRHGFHSGGLSHWRVPGS